MKKFWMFAATLSLAAFTGCEVKTDSGAPGGGAPGGAASTDVKEIIVDGSSTVEPISTRVAEAYRSVDPSVQVSVGTSGTGGGFKKFVAGEIDIADASRPIKDGEAEECREKGIEFVELKVAIDGLSVVINKDNDFCKALTVAQLKAIWEPDSKVMTWKDVNPEWPDEKIGLYGPDTDSGTFDYFTEVICGKGGASRTTYSASANDNDLVLGVTEDKYALGYFGYAYFVENKDRLQAVAISATDDAADAVAPTDANIETGKYTPLSRPLFLYVSKSSLARPEVAAFLEYYVGEGSKAVSDAGYVQLNAEEKAKAQAALKGE
ncbi:MAG: PstS family phosphate ABC transporter substrate-binding protein [Planctomycetaceae bacterium]